MANRLGVYGEFADLYALAWVLANQGRFPEAIDYYQRAFSASKDAGDLNAQLNILSDFARLYLSLIRPADARMVAFSLMEVGSAYAAQGQYQPAWNSFGQAYNVFMAIGDLVSANSCYVQAMAMGHNFPAW
jgi:tetratricopeptide (TPR) repeat protein